MIKDFKYIVFIWFVLYSSDIKVIFINWFNLEDVFVWFFELLRNCIEFYKFIVLFKFFLRNIYYKVKKVVLIC